MTKKIISLVLCIIFAISVFSACGKEEGNVVKLPVAEFNPNISKPEGAFGEESDGRLTATGGLSVMGIDFLKIMIEGDEYEFVISPEVQRKIDVFNKDKKNPQIMIGTMLKLYYEIKDLIFIAKDIEIITAN